MTEFDPKTMIKKNLRFCPRCGHKYSKKPRRGEDLMCEENECSYTFYKNSKPVVSAIFLKDGKILLTKGATAQKKGLWELPGGFLKEGEHPMKGLRREMKEELSAPVKIGKLFDIVIGKYKDQGENVFVLSLYYFATLGNDKLKPNDDVSEAKWFDLKKLPDRIFGEDNRKVLSKLQKY